jgi:hypothetical protein
MFFLAIPYYLSAVWLKGLAIWNALPRPVRLGIIIAICILVAFWRGMVSERAKCEARINASIAAARKMDESIGADAAARRAEQQAGEAARSSADTREIKGYVDELAKRTIEGCRAGDDAGRLNDGLGLSDDAVPEPRPVPPGRRLGGSKPVPLPPRKGE